MKHVTTIKFITADGLKARAKIAGGSESMSDFVTSLPERFDRDGVEIFRSRNVVKRFTVDGTDYIVKRYRRPSLLNRIAYTLLRPSKAKRAFLYSFKFNNAGIATPPGVAYLEVKSHGLLADAYFVSLNSRGSQAFEALVKTPDYDPALAKAVAEMMLRMHRAGIIHGDPNLKNFLYTAGGDGTCSLEVIDTNRSTFDRAMTRKQVIANLARVTHRRDLMETIVRHYASLVGSDADRLVKDVDKRLEAIENDRERRHAIKRYLNLNKK